MGPGLRLEQVQQIQLTHEVRVGVEVMAMPVLDLRAMMTDKAMENPFLALEEPAHDEHSPLEEFESIAARTQEAEASLETTITTQLMMDLRDDLDVRIAHTLIGGIDERGYLRMDTDIVADLLGTDPNHVESILSKMQTECNPAGIGARSLQECLLAQLIAIGDDDPTTRLILESHLPDLAEGRIQHVATALSISAREVQQALERIRRLDPHPAARFERDEPVSLPEAVVVKTDDQWAIKMRTGLLPHLRIDESYVALLDDELVIDESTASRMREMLREAQGLIRAIDLRKTAVIAIADAVVRYQSRFFDEGPSGLKPLTMADVAQMTDLSESTVSRVANSITLDTPKGILDLRYFFHSGVGGSSVDDDASSLAVKEAIRELVNAEDKRKPLSDGALVNLLAERGMNVSRRTVNKYRTALGILSRSKRKSYE